MNNWGSQEWHYKCPGCELEPEIETYLRDTRTKIRVGYICQCGAEVVDGAVVCSHGPSR